MTKLIHNTKAPNLSNALKAVMGLYGKGSYQELARQEADGSWSMYINFLGDEELFATDIRTNRALDILMYFELEKANPHISLQTLITKYANDENHVMKFYQQELEAGRYQPTIMQSRTLKKPLENNPNKLIVEMRDNNLPGQIEDKELPLPEKINNLKALNDLIALENDNGSWDLYAHQSMGAFPMQTNISQQQAARIMRDVEELRGVADAPLPKNMIHHYSQVGKFQKIAAAKSNMETTSEPASEEGNYIFQDIETKAGKNFKFNLN